MEDKYLNNLALLDDEFLEALYEHRDKVVYARISSLTLDEMPIDTLEGRVIGGSITVDGTSTVRRSCNLTMVSNNINLRDYYWALKTKFSLEIGLKNSISNKYPNIIWFPQGKFLIASFNNTLNVNSITISISGKDKMCLLNGELGGSLSANHDFGVIEQETDRVAILNTPNGISNSELILNQDTYYYIDEDAISPIFSQNKDGYKFVKDPDGEWYKSGNYYYKLTNQSIDFENIYQCYKQVLVPDDLFDFSSDSSNKNSRYTRKNVNYYVLDNRNRSSSYPLKDLYIISSEELTEKLTLKTIIRESVHTYAQEPYWNIIINDLEDQALEQLTYTGNVPLLCYRSVASNEFVKIIEGYEDVIMGETEDGEKIQYPPSEDFVWDEDVLVPTENATKVENNGTYTIRKIEKYQDIGFRLTDFIYTNGGSLILSAGESLTSMLDKIVTMLGNYEYFYDIDGRFVFQRKKDYINVNWNLFKSSTGEDSMIDYGMSGSKFSYSFEGSRLFTAVQNTPNLTNLKNDFTVWGQRESFGVQIPIHARYAIDKKPIYYKNLAKEEFCTSDYQRKENGFEKVVDWRELIYRMALDYYAAQGCNDSNPIYDKNGEIVLSSPDNFCSKIGQLNPDYYPNGITGYEIYYTDIQGFWRQLYNPEYEGEMAPKGHYETDNRNNKIWYDGNAQEDQYYRKGETNEYWNKALFETGAGTKINFWFDFLDTNGEISKYSVSQIGDRPKVVNDDKIKNIYNEEVPNFIIYDLDEEGSYSKADNYVKSSFSGYKLIMLPSGLSQDLTISNQTASIQDKIDELLYQFGYCIENITLTTVPVYNVQPNTRIYVADQKVGIANEYIVSRLTVPLIYNGTMSINATLAPERLY